LDRAEKLKDISGGTSSRGEKRGCILKTKEKEIDLNVNKKTCRRGAIRISSHIEKTSRSLATAVKEGMERKRLQRG